MKPAGWYYLTARQCNEISSAIENLHADRENRPGQRAALAAEAVVLGAPLRLTPAEYNALDNRINEGVADAETRFEDDTALTAREWDSIGRGQTKLYAFAHPTTWKHGPDRSLSKSPPQTLPPMVPNGPCNLTYHVYGDDGQEEITADSLQAAADIVRGKITPAMLADGGWAVVRDEATMESIEIGTGRDGA